METNPKISVLIPHYNSGQFFPAAFESLSRQTEVNWEAIVVDDCSTDNSKEDVISIIKHDSRFKFYDNQRNLGSAETLKKCIELSTSSIFARLDPDDTLEPNALEKSIRAHEKYPNVGLVYSNHLICDENLKIKGVHQSKQIEDLSSEESFLFYNEISQFASFKRHFFDRTGGLDTFNKRAEDVDIYLKMCEVAPVFHLDETLYNYRIRSGSRRNFENCERAKFWYVVALVKMAERRDLNVEDFFVKHFARRAELEIYEQREARLKNLIYGNIIFKTAFNLGDKFKIFDKHKFLDINDV